MTNVQSTRIGIDEKVDPDADMSDGERQTKMEEKEAKARAHILEMVCAVCEHTDMRLADRRPARRRRKTT